MKKIIKTFLIAIVIGFAISAKALAQTNQKFSPEQVNDIQKIVREYLIKNPEVLIEVSNALRQKQETMMEHAALKAIAKNKNQIFEDPESPTAGNKNGKVIVAEFFDYQCAHCKEMKEVLQQAIKANPELKVVFKEFPIFGDNSVLAAQAALAAAKQGKYFQMHEALLSIDGPVSQEKIDAAAKQAGLDIEKLKTDMKSAVISKQVQDNRRLAETMQLMGTPAFVIANHDLTKFVFVPGTISSSDLQQKIDSMK